MLNCYSCRNNLILLDPFFGPPVYPFSQWPVTGTILLLLMGSYVPLGFPLGIHDPFANSLGFLGLFANSTLPWALLLTSLGFPDRKSVV